MGVGGCRVGEPFEERANALLQLGVAVAAIDRGDGGRLGIDGSESCRQVFKRSAQDADIIRVLEVVDEGNLSGLLLHVTTEVGPAEPTAEALLRLSEELLEDVVGSLDHGHERAVLVASHGVTEELVAVAIQVVEDHRLGAESGSPLAHSRDLRAEVDSIKREGGTDLLEAKVFNRRQGTLLWLRFP